MSTRNRNPKASRKGRGNRGLGGRGSSVFSHPPNPGDTSKISNYFDVLSSTEPLLGTSDIDASSARTEDNISDVNLSDDSMEDESRATNVTFTSAIADASQSDNISDNTSMPTNTASPKTITSPTVTQPHQAQPSEQIQASDQPTSNLPTPTKLSFLPDNEDISDEETVSNGARPAPIKTSRPDASSQRKPVKDVTFKYLFQTPEEVTPNEAAGRCLDLLSAIAKIKTIHPIKIYDKNSNIMKKFSRETIPTFQNQLQITQHTTRHNNQQVHNYWIVFQIRTQLTLTNIRQDDVVFHVLTQTHGRLSLHPWHPHFTNIVSIGFVVGALPYYQTEEHFTKEMKNKLVNDHGIRSKELHLQAVRTRVSATYNGRKITCEAFDIQLRRADVAKLFIPISKSYPGTAPQKLMSYRDRYDNPTQFAKAVHLQAKFQTSHKIIAITGITEYAMFSFESVLQKSFPSIRQIFPTSTTTSKNKSNQPIGRWNVLCDASTFEPTAKDMFHKLPKLFTEHIEAQGISSPEGAEPVKVISNFRGKPDGDQSTQSIDSGRDTYRSAWTVGLADTTMEEIEVPIQIINLTPNPLSYRQTPPVPTHGNSWVSVAKASHPNTTTLPQQSRATLPPAPDPLLSQLHDSLQQLQLQNQALQNQVKELQAAMQVQHQYIHPPVPPPSSPPNLTASPPTTTDPTDNQLLSLLMARLDNMESTLEARQATQFQAVEAQLQAQQQEMSIIRDFQLTQPSVSLSSPPRKKTHHSTSPLTAQSSTRPDDTPEQGEFQDDDSHNDL